MTGTIASADSVSGGALREAIARLSVDEKAMMVAGANMWRTHAVDAIGLQSLLLSDGPNGVRGHLFDERDLATCTPCGSALGATWDPDIAARVGALVGDEARRRGVSIVLGPTMNIHRSPLGGRGFECLAEDPDLSGKLAAAWVCGVQSRGVAATPKHFVCNDAETSRTSVDCVVDERALREIYLVPFERAVAAGAFALMTAYNKVNGEYCAANAELVSRVLKGEWGFDGVVISDWFSHGDTVGSATGGLDLEMPGPGRLFGPALADAVRTGAVPEAILDDKLVRLVRLAQRVASHDSEASAFDESGSSATHQRTLVDAAAASFVLLKNEGDLLPIAPERVHRLAVIGPNATDPCYQGGGSAHVSMTEVPTPLQAIAQRFAPFAEVVYEKGCSPRRSLPGIHELDVRATDDPAADKGFTVEYLVGSPGELRSSEIRSTSKLIWLGDLPGLEQGEGGTVRISGFLTPESTGSHTFAVRGSAPCRLSVDGVEVLAFAPSGHDAVAALFSEEEARGGIELDAGKAVLVQIELDAAPARLHLVAFGCQPPQPADLLDRAVRAAAQADAAIVIVGTSEDTERENVDRDSTALPGQQDELIRRVLAVNPATVVVVNAATAVDMSWSRDAPAVLYCWFPGQAFGTALTEVLAGERDPGGRMPLTIARSHGDYPAWSTTPDEHGQLVYEESLLVGYRHFDANEIEPEFCFGHGLSYAQFSYEQIESSSTRLQPGESCEVKVSIRNTAARPGKEVVQVYIADEASSLPRPPRELKAFAAVVLEAGEQRDLTFTLDARALSFWDQNTRSWRAEPGLFEVAVGRSSRDIRLRQQLTLTDD